MGFPPAGLDVSWVVGGAVEAEAESVADGVDGVGAESVERVGEVGVRWGTLGVDMAGTWMGHRTYRPLRLLLASLPIASKSEAGFQR